MGYEAVFFDLGGTLFRYRDVQRATSGALLEATRRLGIEAPRRELGRAYGRASREVIARYADRPFYLHRDLFRDTFVAYAEALGAKAAEADFDVYARGLREALVEHMVLREDCLETLRRLRGKGLGLSIVSNIDDDQLHPIVESSGLAEHLDHWTSSEEAGSCKPDPRFFHLALEKAGVDAGRVLFVGDSPEHDVDGAKAVGMTAVLIAEEDDPSPLQSGRRTALPDHRIRRLAELLALVDAGPDPSR